MIGKNTNWSELLGEGSGPLLRPATSAEYLGISISAFYDQIQAGSLPPLIKIGARAAGMPRPWLDALIKARANGAI